MQVLSQNKAKQIRALHQKKFRSDQFSFLVEGSKAVLETLESDWEVEFLVMTDSFFEANRKAVQHFSTISSLVSAAELSNLSHFETNESVLAVVRQKQPTSSPESKVGLWLAVESISDPGNLGTIIRLADWFGLGELICLGDCVEWYNPKVISSTMGSFIRVRQVKMSVSDFGKQTDRPILAAKMHGTNLYDFQFPESGVLVIGNEAHGLSDDLLKLASRSLSIPAFGKAESLNAGIATGILLNQWRFSKHKSGLSAK